MSQSPNEEANQRIHGTHWGARTPPSGPVIQVVRSQKMRVITIIAIVIGLTGCGHTGTGSPSSPRTEVERYDENDDGKTDRIVTKVYDGTNRLSRIAQVDRDHDGKMDFEIGQYWSHGEQVFHYSNWANETRASRSYRHHGKDLLTGVDRDGDGFYELMIFFRQDAVMVPSAVFLRTQDGVALPAPQDVQKDVMDSFLIDPEVQLPKTEKGNSEQAVAPYG